MYVVLLIMINYDQTEKYEFFCNILLILGASFWEKHQTSVSKLQS